MKEQIIEITKKIDGLTLVYGLKKIFDESGISYEITIKSLSEDKLSQRNVVIKETDEDSIKKLLTQMSETYTLPIDLEYIVEDYTYNKKSSIII